MTQTTADKLGLARPLGQGRDDLRTPLYHQIYLLLRQKIEEGTLANGSLLPAEAELGQSMGVSRITVKRALDELARDGFVARARGRGTTVVYQTDQRRMRTWFEGQMEDLIALGLETDVRLVEFDYVPAPEDVASALRCGIGERVQKSVRVRSFEGDPFSYLTAYVPESIGAQYSRDDLVDRPLLSLLEESGVSVGSASQSISASLADPATAEQLDLSIGAALIAMTRIVYDTDENPVEYISALYRPDRYQYRMSLSRGNQGGAAVWSPSKAGYNLS